MQAACLIILCSTTWEVYFGSGDAVQVWMFDLAVCGADQAAALMCHRLQMCGHWVHEGVRCMLGVMRQ
jgi:hypothetical protein